MSADYQKVLVVDDREEFRSLCKIALKTFGKKEVRCAADGEEALQVAEEWPPDLILLDFNMPVMDGPATFDRLQSDSRWKDIPVIFLTASSDHPRLEEFKARGLKGTISKPFHPQNFIQAIADILG